MTHLVPSPARRLPMTKRLLLSATALVAAGTVLATPAGAAPIVYNTPGPHNDAIVLNSGNTAQAMWATSNVTATFSGTVDFQSGGPKTLIIGNTTIPDGKVIFSPSDLKTDSQKSNLYLNAGILSIGNQLARDALSSGRLNLSLFGGTLDLSGSSLAVRDFSGTGNSKILNSTAGTIASLTIMTAAGSPSLNLASTISDDTGVVALDIRGSGYVDVRGNNSYSGGTSIIGAQVYAAHSNALGTGTISMLSTATNTASLWLSNGIILNNNLYLDSSQPVNLGAAVVVSGTLRGDISGDADIRKVGGGWLRLQGQHLGSGRVLVEEGDLVVGSAQPGSGTINNMSEVHISRLATLRVREDEAIGHLAGRGTVDVGTNAAFWVGMDDSSMTFDGNITGLGRFFKTGQGTLTLTQASTFDSAFYLQQGGLSVRATDALGTSTLFTDEDTRLTLADGVRLDNYIIIDDIGFEIEVANNHSATLGGDITSGNGDYGFQKTGSGTLVLTSADSDVDLVEVNGGTLRVDGRLRVNESVTVQADATLTGRGTVDGDVTIDGGGVLKGRAGDRLTVTGDMMLNDDSYIDVALGAPSTSALFNVGGNLTLDGALTITDAGGFGRGIYRLFDYEGGLTDNGLEIVGSPPGIPRTNISVQTAIANEVNIVVAGDDPCPGEVPETQFWDGGGTTADGRIGGGTGTWNNTTTNWTRVNGDANDAWGGRFAVFQTEGGVVSVDSSGAPVTVTGMQFATDGYTVTGGSLTLSAPQTLIRVGDGTENGTQMTSRISSNLIGSGGLVKDDLGTLVLDGVNSYAGDTIVRNGWLVGDVDSIRNNLLNNAGVTFLQHEDATFAGVIEGTGRTVKDGSGTLKLAAGSTTDWEVGQGVLVSQAGQLRGDVEIGGEGMLQFQQAASAAYQGVLSGSGAFDVAGQNNARVILSADSSAFNGTTSVSSGELTVDGKLGGQTTVRSGGRLSGTGTLATANVEAGAMHGPGNSVSTQTVTGNYTNRGTLQVDITPTTADKLIVGGNVDIGGATLDLLMSSAPLSEWNSVTGPYTLIQNNGQNAIAGQFASVLNPLAFLSHSLNYVGGDGNDLTLQLTRNAVKFADAGKTRNQIAVATALDRMAGDSRLVGHVALLSQTDARAAFDRLSGEIHASAKTALIDDSIHVRTAVNDRIRAAFEGVGAAAMPVMSYGPEGGQFDAASTDRFAVWGNAFGSWANVDGDGNAAKLEHSIGGVLFGGDALVSEAVRLGVLAGYTQSNFSIEERASSGSSDNAHLGIYAGAKWGRVALRGGLAYAWHDIETARRVAFGGLSEQLKGDYDAGTFQAFGEAGYRIDTAVASFEPFAALAHVSLRTDSFAETGGISAVTAKSQTTSVSYTTLGLRASTDFVLAGMGATARGTLGWRHAFGDVTPASVQAFAGSQPFAIYGAPLGRDSAIIEAALDLDLTAKATLGFAYHGQLASNAQDHGIKANLGVRF